MFYAVMNWDENFKVVKLQSFSTLVEAETFASENGGILPGTSADAFASEELDGPEEGWVADPVGKVLLYIPVDHTIAVWEALMVESDRVDISREMEDHIEDHHGGVVGNPFGQAKYDEKKAKRAQKP